MVAVGSCRVVRNAIEVAKAERRRRSGVLNPIVGAPVIYGRLAEPEEFKLMVRLSDIVTGG